MSSKSLGFPVSCVIIAFFDVVLVLIFAHVLRLGGDFCWRCTRKAHMFVNIRVDFVSSNGGSAFEALDLHAWHAYAEQEAIRIGDDTVVATIWPIYCGPNPRFSAASIDSPPILIVHTFHSLRDMIIISSGEPHSVIG